MEPLVHVMFNRKPNLYEMVLELIIIHKNLIMS